MFPFILKANLNKRYAAKDLQLTARPAMNACMTIVPAAP